MSILRRSCFVLVVSVAAAVAFAGPPAAREKFKPAPKNGVPGVYIVLLEKGVARKPGGAQNLPRVAEVAQGLGQLHGGEVQESWEHALQAFVVRMPEARARKLAEDPRVAAVEQDSTISAPVGHCYNGTPWADSRTLPSSTVSPQTITCPNPHPDGDSLPPGTDPLCRDNWGLDRTDQVHYDDRYYFPRNGTGVHVYVLDTGIRWTHREFHDANGVSRVSGGVDARTATLAVGTATNTNDEYGHGTHVAGIIGGRTFGVAKNVRLHPVRTIGAPGTTTVVQQLANTIRGLNWVVQDVNGQTDHNGNGLPDNVIQRPAIVNWSGGNDADWINTQTLKDAVEGLLDNDIILVQSVGNHEPDYSDSTGMTKDADDYAFGGDFPDVIVAGGMDHNVERWTIDGCSRPNDDPPGWECGSISGSSIDIWAPAAWVIAANRTGDNMTCKLSGTSMAAPHVSGAAAIYLQNNTSASAAEVTRALRANGHWWYLAQSASNTKTIGEQSDNVFLRIDTTILHADTAPVASFTMTCPGRQCTLNASASSDNSAVTYYWWQFGDGTTDGGPSMSTVKHTFPANFSGHVVLRVYDASYMTDHLRKAVAVNADAPPEASVSYSCNGLTCTFTTFASSDDIGIVSKQMSYGDGVTEPVGPSSVHTYASSGTYTVAMTVTDTAGQTAVHEFSLPVTLGAPTNTMATGNGATVTISWTPVSGAASYDIERRTAWAPWAFLKNVGGGSSSTTDVPAATGGIALYRVIARDTNGPSQPGLPDVAWVGSFTDDPIAAPPTYVTVKAAHITEMRRAVNTLRNVNGDPDLYSPQQLDANLLRGQVIDDDHWHTLMNSLNAARAALSLTPVGWGATAPSGPPTQTVVQRTHIHNLRAGVK